MCRSVSDRMGRVVGAASMDLCSIGSRQKIHFLDGTRKALDGHMTCEEWPASITPKACEEIPALLLA